MPGLPRLSFSRLPGSRRGSFLQAGLFSSYSCVCFTAAPSLHDRYSLLRYYEPLRLPARAGTLVMDSLGPLGCPTLPGLPGSFAVLSQRAVPNHPGRLGGCTCSFLPRRFQASSTLEDWPPSSCVTRPNRIRGYSGSQVCIPGFHRHGCPRQLRCRYMRVRIIRMMNSFQFTRSARLTLVYQRRQGRRENNAKFTEGPRLAGAQFASRRLSYYAAAWE